MTGARLVEAGITDVRIVEKGGDFGGTWYWNRYPGAQCDTASMVYMPLLEETGHQPTEKYAHAPEILAQCQRIGRQYKLYDNALFHTEVEDLTWDESRQVWVIKTNRGDAFTASFIGLGTGPLRDGQAARHSRHRGLQEGHSFHTSRWDYDYTGGDPATISYGGSTLSKLADKRVAIIGTGATSVQAVPHLARACKELYVFQRTPSSIDVRANRPLDPEWFSGIATPGWQKRWLENFTANQSMGAWTEEDLVQDGWTGCRAAAAAASSEDWRPEQRTPQGMLAAFEDLDFWREDGGDPRLRRSRPNRRRPPDRPAPEGLVPPAVQAAMLPRRLSAGVQRAGRAPGRHRRQGRRADHRYGRRGRWPRIRGRLHHLRLRLRGRHRVQAPRRLRPDRPRRAEALAKAWAEGMRSKHGIHVRGFPNAFFVQPTQ